MNEPLTKRRELLRDNVLANLDKPIRESPELKASLPDLIASVKASGLEGLVAKRPLTSPASAGAPGRTCASTAGSRS